MRGSFAASRPRDVYKRPGAGLGNQFLANIRETDAIAEVVRFFGDPDVTHVAGKVDPRSDVDTIKTELILADIATVRCV